MDLSSEGTSFWMGLAEKFFGLILVVLSLVMIYFTATSANVLGGFAGLFGFLGVTVLVAGGLLVVFKAPE
jgi:hypothetical protein